jgi:hypothetical protein
MIWSYTTDFSDPMHYFESAIETDDGYIVATGSFETERGDTDIFLLCLSDEGAYQWEKSFEKQRDQQATSVIQTIDGGFAILGSTVDDFQIGTFWLLKTDDMGVISEFPSVVIFPLVVVASLVLLVYKLKLRKVKR